MSTVRPISARRDKQHVLYAGVGLALGCGVGAGIGVIFGPMGVIIGAGIGNAAGLMIWSRRRLAAGAYSIRGVRFTKADGVKHRHSVKAGATPSEGGSS